MKDTVYPWANYDWDYTTYVDNNYNRNRTKVTDKGTFSALFKNPKAMVKINNGFMLDANPGKLSSSANSDLEECDKNDTEYKGCMIVNSLKKEIKENQKPPFNDNFFSKYPISGEGSSSYFIKVGSCPKNYNKETCDNKGYQWISNPIFDQLPSDLKPSSFKEGSCFKPRYAYVRNQPGMTIDLSPFRAGVDEMKSLNKSVMGILPNQKSSLDDIYNSLNAGAGLISKATENLSNQMLAPFKGSIPSIIGDGMSINPFNSMNIINGKDTADYKLMSCEGFMDGCPKKIYSLNKDDFKLSQVFFILILFIFLVIFLVFN